MPIHTDRDVDMSDPQNHDYKIKRIGPMAQPTKMAEAGIEGYVIREFSIDKHGRPKNIKIIETDTIPELGKVAVEALSLYKYYPRVVNGVRVQVDGIKQKVTFCLRDEKGNPLKELKRPSNACENKASKNKSGS